MEQRGDQRETSGMAQELSHPAKPWITLPLILNDRNRLAAGWSMFLASAALYLTSNHFHLREPQHLPLLEVDRWMPFVPESVWIYSSDIPLFISTYIICKERLNFNRFFYSFFSLQWTSAFIFTLFPTIYPRDLFPFGDPSLAAGATAWHFHWLRFADSPANCFPSLHVSTVLLASFVFLDEQREKFRFYFFWAICVVVSTLTTKQHYFWDVMGGALLAVFHFWFFHRKAAYREPEELGAQAKR